MAGSLTDAFEIDILKAITAQATTILTTTPLGALYVGLFTTTPTDATAGTEAAGGGYARVDSKGKWATPAAGAVSNNAAIAFATFSGAVSAGAPFTAFGLFTAATAGTLLAYGTLSDQTKTGGTNDTLSFGAGALTITAD